MIYYNLCGNGSQHSNISKGKGGEEEGEGVRIKKITGMQDSNSQGIVKKLSELVCSGFFLFITTIRISIQCHIFISVYLDYWSLAYQ
jgi:hypothetical protein